jgi:hypothetical protein
VRDDVRASAQRMYEAFNTRNFTATEEIFTADFYSHPLDTTGRAVPPGRGNGSMRSSPTPGSLSRT